MHPHIVELSQDQSIVLHLITKHKCISVAEMCIWTVGAKRWGASLTKSLNEEDIDRVIPSLIAHRLVQLSSSGSNPKRYCLRPISVTKKDLNEVENEQSPDYTSEEINDIPELVPEIV